MRRCGSMACRNAFVPTTEHHSQASDCRSIEAITRLDESRHRAGRLTARQKKFDRFRLTFNHERPHEALSNETPGSVYVPSARILPSSVASFQYPKSFLTRRVNNSGDISRHKGRVF